MEREGRCHRHHSGGARQSRERLGSLMAASVLSGNCCPSLSKRQGMAWLGWWAQAPSQVSSLDAEGRGRRPSQMASATSVADMEETLRSCESLRL